MAAWTGNAEFVGLLLKMNARANATAQDDFTPLHFAAQSSGEGVTECIQLLVKKDKKV